MTAYTPGPWRWWPCKDGSFQPKNDYVQIAAGNTHVAKVLITSVTEADLALMTAAPDMLAALIAVTRAEEARSWGVFGVDQKTPLGLARAAIAKATGEIK